MLFAAAGLALAAWLLLLGMLAISTRPRFDPPLPASMDIGAEPPAIASYLVHRWTPGAEAPAATLLDLAGRDFVDIEQVAEHDYVLRPRPSADAAALTVYERRVWNHLLAKCSGGVVPAAALDLGAGSVANRWTSAFAKEVVADARARGLSRPRWSTRATAVVLGSALGPAAIFAVAMDRVPRDPGEDSPVWAALALSWGALAWLFYRLRSQRDTAAGRAAAARWLALRDYLAEDPAFPGMAPAAEAIWDRYLAYAAAFGLARTAVAALPLRAEDPQAAWSAYGGQWRLLKLRWPGGFLRPGAGMRPIGAALIGAVCTLIGGTLAWKLSPLVNGRALDELRQHVVLNGWE
ncbi:MAG: hypothetical protein QOG49_1161, partial [Frankiaceae bacterium]|nr:hypothetical protein [Frankiaceae bacterium]